MLSSYRTYPPKIDPKCHRRNLGSNHLSFPVSLAGRSAHEPRIWISEGLTQAGS